MTDKAVATATYSDFRLIRTRSTAQIVLEIPIEQAEAFIDRFGIPIPGKEMHIAIAPLVGPVEENDLGAANNAVLEERSKRAKEAYRNMPEWEKARVRAVQLCKDARFQKWVALNFGIHGTNEKNAVTYMQYRCGIESRREIATDERAYKAFIALEQEYRQAVGLSAEQRG